MRKLFLLFLLLPLFLVAQNENNIFIVSGKVLDANNKEVLPFVTVIFKGTNIGTTTDFEGNFKLKTNYKIDSLVFSYVGYKRISAKINYANSQNNIYEMSSAIAELKAVKIKPGLNPALRIINNAKKYRDVNDENNLSSYQYNCYNKADISLNNISDEMKNRKVFKSIKSLFDTASQMKNEEGKYILPVFISETYSQYFYNKEPSKSKELIQASLSSGVGIGDKDFISDLMGSSLQKNNFNQNYVRILRKDFISPLANNSHTFYVYTLLDSVLIDNKKCYKLQLNLKREQDLGFIGHLWIQDSTWALKRIDVEISKSANLNFIDRLKIQQELIQTNAGPYIVYKNRLVFDIAELTKKSTGMIAKFYNSFSDIVVNEPKNPDFFDKTIVHENENTLERDSAYWKLKRPEQFTSVEKQMYQVVDSIKNLPVIRTYIDIIRFVVEGYKRFDGVDVGPYVFLYAYNNVEGNRIRLGFKTNHLFNRKWILKSYLAYGFKDERLKYNIGIDRIVSRKNWSVIGAQFRDDYDLLGITTDLGSLANNSSSFFQAISIFGHKIRLNHTQEIKLNFLSQPKRDWTYRINLQRNTFSPLGNFVFAYKTNYSDTNSTATIRESFTNTQASIELRWAYKETMIVRGNDRLRFQRSKFPILTFTYIRGFKNIFDGNFDYDKFQINATHHLNTGTFGTADYWLSIGKIWGRLPYPLLDVARGNQTFLYSDFNYSLMNFYEFISDEYIHFTYVQHVEGLFFNRIPLIRKWKWRNFAFVKAAYGNLDKKNLELLPINDRNKRPLTKTHSFEDQPYIEIGYGIENIFRIFSINMVHRLTHLDVPQARSWGVNAGIRFQF